MRFADGRSVRKASQQVPDGDNLVVAQGRDYVSRGAFKLLGAVEAFHPQIAGKVCLDLGASTGGFTEVLLEQGAKRVYAVDVGTGQLHERLRNDVRVVSLEQTDARHLTNALVPEPIGFLTGDLSFISLKKVIPCVVPFLAEECEAVLLIKPQFEVGKGAIGSGGIVRDAEVRRQCVEDVVRFCVEQFHWRLRGQCESPICGGDGNQEYLAYFQSGRESE